jgi:hypothetical protein
MTLTYEARPGCRIRGGPQTCHVLTSDFLSDSHRRPSRRPCFLNSACSRRDSRTLLNDCCCCCCKSMTMWVFLSTGETSRLDCAGAVRQAGRGGFVDNWRCCSGWWDTRRHSKQPRQMMGKVIDGISRHWIVTFPVAQAVGALSSTSNRCVCLSFDRRLWRCGVCLVQVAKTRDQGLAPWQSRYSPMLDCFRLYFMLEALTERLSLFY